MATPNYTPPNLYNVTVPDLFTQIALDNPARDVVQIIKEHPGAPTDSVRITWATFIQHAQNAAAELRACWASKLHGEQLSASAMQPRKHGTPPVVVGMLGANGYEYYVNLLACSLNRWTPLLISPRNSPPAIEHLLRSSKANILVVDASGSRIFDQSISGVIVVPFANLETKANGQANGPASPLMRLTREETEMEMNLPAFYLHTSGSTGHPKIITWTHSFFLGGCRTHIGDGLSNIGRPFYSIPPLCHAMGMFAFGMFVPAQGFLATFVSSPTPKPPSAASLLTYVPFIKGGVVAMPPSILEELHDLGPDAVKTVADGINMVIFAGAPLKRVTGDALLAAGLKLITAFGATELGPTASIYPQPPEDWEYVEFRDVYDMKFLPVDDTSELRELIVAPAEECPAVINHENPHGYATEDIWVPHPTRPNLWKHHSRKGDVTVLSNGEKTDNKQIAELLLQGKHIRYVQVFGAGRPLNGVLLQPSDPSQSTSEFLSQIQPIINNANSIIPRHSRLVPELIIVAPQDKPFATTDKATVKVKETLDKYTDEINSGYALLEEGGEGGWIFTGVVTNSDDIKPFLRMTVQRLLDKEIPDTADLFEHGLDSLLAIRLRAALLAVIKNTPTASQPVPRNIIYTFPTIGRLTGYLISRASTDRPQLTDSSRQRIERSIAKFSSSFGAHRPGTKVVHGSVVALTGSTGSLGCSLLALLLEREDVSKIYLLNRSGSQSQQERQAAGFRSRGLDPSILGKRKDDIIYLDIDLSRGDLGLTTEAYEEVRDNVTHIIHAAWHLNFNLILESYEHVHIAGVRHLINLALSSPQAQTPRLIFLSSVAAAGAYQGPSQAVSVGDAAGQVLVPEEPIDDPSMPLDQGYGQGKYVSERVIVAAVEKGLQATVVRVGQLSGVTANGAWSLTEHLPMVLRSSVVLGVIPDDLPPVRWVPSDIAASVIIKHTFLSNSSLEYFHVENPVATQWKAIAEAVHDFSPRPLSLISLKAWLAHITAQDVDVEKVPAVLLLDFYQGVAQSNASTALGWQRSVQVAPELAVGPMTPSLVKKYLAYQLQHLPS